MKIKTIYLESIFGKLTCNIANSKSVVIELPKEIPAAIRGVKVRFKINLKLAEDGRWDSFNPVVTRVDFGETSAGLRLNVASQVESIWQKHWNSNSMLRMQIRLAELDSDIEAEERRIQSNLETIKMSENSIAEARRAIPILQSQQAEIRANKSLTKRAKSAIL